LIYTQFDRLSRTLLQRCHTSSDPGTRMYLPCHTMAVPAPTRRDIGPMARRAGAVSALR